MQTDEADGEKRRRADAEKRDAPPDETVSCRRFERDATESGVTIEMQDFVGAVTARKPAQVERAKVVGMRFTGQPSGELTKT